jgi:glycosyltransferase involved in cell wall biosynthesis
MATLPPISIIVPNYNGGETLEATLLSLLEQNYQPLEILVADGGSTDNSVEVIRKYEKHLAWWTSERDRGQSHAINKGLARATGEVLNWLCSDDLLMPGALQKVATAFDDDPSADIVVGAGQFKYLHRGGAVVTWSPDAHRISLMPCDCAVPQPSCFFRRRLLSRPGPLDESLHFALDMELWCYFLNCGAMWKLIDDVLSLSVNSGNNKTCAGGERMLAEVVAVYNRYVRERVPLTFWQMLIRRRFQRARSRFSAQKWKLWRFVVRPPEWALDRVLGCFYGLDRVRTMNWSSYYELADVTRSGQTRRLQQLGQGVEQ